MASNKKDQKSKEESKKGESCKESASRQDQSSEAIQKSDDGPSKDSKNPKEASPGTGTDVSTQKSTALTADKSKLSDDEKIKIEHQQKKEQKKEDDKNEGEAAKQEMEKSQEEQKKKKNDSEKSLKSSKSSKDQPTGNSGKYSYKDNFLPPDPPPTDQDEDLRISMASTIAGTDPQHGILELTILPPIFDHRLSLNRNQAIDPLTRKKVRKISRRKDSWTLGRMFSNANIQPVPKWVRWTLRYSATIELIRFVGMLYVFIRKVLSRDTRIEDPQYTDNLIISMFELMVGGTAWWCSYPGKDLIWTARINELIRGAYMAFLLISRAIDDSALRADYMSMDLVWNVYMALFLSLYIAMAEAARASREQNSRPRDSNNSHGLA